jgi:hypothetical protein
VICTAVRGANRRYKVIKIVLRIAYVDSSVVERGVVGAINIDLKYLSSYRRPVALGSTGTHAARAKPMIQCLGAAANRNTSIWKHHQIPLTGKCFPTIIIVIIFFHNDLVKL